MPLLGEQKGVYFTTKEKHGNSEPVLKSSRIYLSVCLPFATLILATPAHAYVDPGTGGMLYQTVVMAGVAVAGFFAVFRNKIRSLFSGRKKKDAGDGATHD